MTESANPPSSQSPIGIPQSSNPFPPSPLRAVDFWSLTVIVVVMEYFGRGELARLGLHDPLSEKAIRGTGVIRLAQLTAVLIPMAVFRRAGPGAFGLRLGDWRRGLAWAAGAPADRRGGFVAAAVAARLWDGTDLVAAALGPSPLERATSDRSRFLMAASMVAVGPLAEEVFFRGILYQGLRRRLSGPECIVITALFFAAAHMQAVPVIQFIGGLVFGLLYEKTGTLFAPFLVHAAGNLAILLLPLWRF
jgi:membrane protease YdiL (CAAX protease family)